MNPQRETTRTRGKLARWGVLVAAVALTLAGCMRVDMAVTLNTDDTMSGKMTMAVSDEMAKSLNMTPQQLSDELNSSTDLSGEGVTTEPYAQDGYTGTTYTFQDTPIDEGAGDSESLSIVRDGNNYRVSGTMDLTASGLSGDTGETMDAANEAMAKQMQVSVSITFPGAISDANGAINGNTVTWNLKYGEKTNLSAVGSAEANGKASAAPTQQGQNATPGAATDKAVTNADNATAEKDKDSGFPWLWVGIGGGALLLIIIVVVIIVMSRKKKAKAAQQLSAGAEGMAQYGAPTGQPYQPGGYQYPGQPQDPNTPTQQYPGQQPPTQSYQQPGAYQQPGQPGGYQYPGQPQDPTAQPGGYPPQPSGYPPQDPNTPTQQYPGQQPPTQSYQQSGAYQQPGQPGGYQYPGQPQDPTAQPGGYPPQPGGYPPQDPNAAQDAPQPGVNPPNQNPPVQ